MNTGSPTDFAWWTTFTDTMCWSIEWFDGEYHQHPMAAWYHLDHDDFVEIGSTLDIPNNWEFCHAGK